MSAHPIPVALAFSITARVARTVGTGPSPRSASMYSTAGDSLRIRTSGRGFIQPFSMKSRYCGIRCTPCESTPLKFAQMRTSAWMAGVPGGHSRLLERLASERLERLPIDHDIRHRFLRLRLCTLPRPALAERTRGGLAASREALGRQRKIVPRMPSPAISASLTGTTPESASIPAGSAPSSSTRM